MSDIDFYINAYFSDWESNLEKASELLLNQRYYLEGMLVLCCYIDAFATLRFPNMKVRDRYVKIVTDYSCMKTFYEQIDLLFSINGNIPSFVIKNFCEN